MGRAHSMRRAGKRFPPRTQLPAKRVLCKRPLMLWQARPHRKPLLTTPGASQHPHGLHTILAKDIESINCF